MMLCVDSIVANQAPAACASVIFQWRQHHRIFSRFCLYGLILNLSIINCAVSEESPRRFILNEDMIGAVGTPADPRACYPNGVLGDLFKQISPVAKIYPTENYYYFSFYRGGKAFSGSLRLAVDSRDKGLVQYVCYETYTSWLEIGSGTEIQKELSKADGVSVSKIKDFEYDVEFQGVTVKFLLNQVDQTPDKEKLGRGEKFSGRIFDESGLVFDLVYNKPVKAFYFVLDTKTRVADAFVKVKDNVYVGKRTGFAFFEDTVMKRLILIAVHSEEINKNTPYDGPFDQLPENFFEKLGFWNNVYDAYPKLRGKLTSGGAYIDSGLIFAIMPYRFYFSKTDLKFVDRCAPKKSQGTKLILCLIGKSGLKPRY
jgi:hypothetical protein